MKKDEDLCGRSPTRDKLERECKVNAQAHNRENGTNRNMVHQVARAMEEQLREDQEELKTREQNQRAKDAKRTRGIVHENYKIKGTSPVQDEMGKPMHHDEQELRWHWNDNEGGWVDPELCAKGRRVEVESIRRHKMNTSVSERCAYVRRRRHPSKQDGGRLTRDNQRSPTCARWVVKEYKTHARSELYASNVEERFWHWSDVRRAYLCTPARSSVFVELPPEDYQAGDEHMCGLLQYSLCGTRDAAHNWEEELTSTLSDLKLTRGIACPCVWQGTFCGNRARRRHHDWWRTIGGGRLLFDLEKI